jgi:hypothetical protein
MKKTKNGGKDSDSDYKEERKDKILPLVSDTIVRKQASKKVQELIDNRSLSPI